MGNYRIILFCDSKFRDLPGTALVRYHLQQRLPDANIQIVTYHMWREAIESFAPHLVVLNHMQGKRNQMIASYVKRHGGLVVVQFNEGILEFENKAKVFESQQGSEYVDAFLCWNEQTAELVDGIIVGCPRFDIYTKPFNKLIDSRELFCDKYNLDANTPIVLLGDSWPSAKFKYSMQTFHRMDWRDLGNTVADEWSDPDKFAQYQFDQQEDFKLTTLVLRRNNPAFQYVIKTHPMSDYDRWQHWGGEYGIPIIHGEYIFNCLNAADVFIGKLGSITIAESWMSNTAALKLKSDYVTASSMEQMEVDGLNYDSLTTIDEKNEFYSSLKMGKYLMRWGFVAPGNFASSDTAAILEGLLENTQFTLRYEPDLPRLRKALSSHDLEHSLVKHDGFGNWGKATLRRDVFEWQHRIEALSL